MTYIISRLECARGSGIYTMTFVCDFMLYEVREEVGEEQRGLTLFSCC